jgi:hypothetical protein
MRLGDGHSSYDLLRFEVSLGNWAVLQQLIIS